MDKMLRVSDIMTREVLTLEGEASLREAMELLSTKHLSGIPIVAGERVTGIISLSDIIGFLIAVPESEAGEHLETLVESLEEPEDEEDDEELRSVSMDEDVWSEWSESPSMRAEENPLTTESLLDQHTVEEAMNREVISVGSSESVKSAATIMAERGIHRVIVIDKGALVGIVSALDIARAVSNLAVRRPRLGKKPQAG
jgi:CBS domain-containing protein